jgi:DNA invertase Pin-like site-specific DNA recombinase
MDKIGIIYCYDLAAEVQRLHDLAQRHGCTFIQTFTESAATAPGRRAGITAIQRMLAKGEVQVLIVPSLLILGASLDETVALIAKMSCGKVDLIAEAEGIDTTNPAGAAWMASIASLQGYREAVHRQTARAGQLRAKQAGVKFGRPPIPHGTIEKVRTALEAGHGIRPTARKTGVSPARVAAEKAAMKGGGNVL